MKWDPLPRHQPFASCASFTISTPTPIRPTRTGASAISRHLTSLRPRYPPRSRPADKSERRRRIYYDRINANGAALKLRNRKRELARDLSYGPPSGRDHYRWGATGRGRAKIAASRAYNSAANSIRYLAGISRGSRSLFCPSGRALALPWLAGYREIASRPAVSGGSGPAIWSNGRHTSALIRGATGWRASVGSPLVVKFIIDV